MRRTLLPVVAVLAVACATSLSKEGAAVKVYETDPTVKDAAKSLPEGCRLLETSGPMDQQESERAYNDPYRAQRNAVGARGGNVLLVDSQPLIIRPNTDCPPNDRSPHCLEASHTWYRVTFGYYTCTPEASRLLQSQAESAATGGAIFSWKLGSSKVAVAQLKARILAMMQEGVGTDVIVAYVSGQHLKQKLSAEDVIDWKKSGIDEKIIEAALRG